MLAVFTLALSISAALLFLIQPMVAKMVLPVLGGAPAVWNTCLVFFQVTLLAGYLYAHGTTTWLGVRRQSVLHAALLLLSLALLPISLPRGWDPGRQAPVPWLLERLLLSIGAPFFLLSATSPMLQKWFSQTRHPGAKDPYFLYAASNTSSLVALIAYPALMEPMLRLKVQSLAWAGGCLLFMILVLACQAMMWRAAATRRDDLSAGAAAVRQGSSVPVTARAQLRWVVLAFVPSSLMLGLTAYLSTDIAAVPLLWVVPLALYLLSFALVFARRQLVSRQLIRNVFPFLVVSLALVMLSGVRRPASPILLAHLLTLFVVAMTCHGALADSRPPSRHLTRFYLWISAGGALGGMFNALIAPLVFRRIVEYPLALVLACLFLPRAGPEERARSRWLDILLPVAVGLLASIGYHLLALAGSAQVTVPAAPEDPLRDVVFFIYANAGGVRRT